MIQDIKPAKGFIQTTIAKNAYSRIGLLPRHKTIEVKTPDMFNDSIIVIDLNSGCHFRGEKLIHTNKCLCGEE